LGTTERINNLNCAGSGGEPGATVTRSRVEFLRELFEFGL